MTDAYDDIIHLPHHISATRARMPLSDRAAQFSPFAALTGHDAAILETARLTDEKRDLDETELRALDRELQKVLVCLEDEPEVTITYFEPDNRKSGGIYRTVTDSVKKLDTFERQLVLKNGTKILINNVMKIQIKSQK